MVKLVSRPKYSIDNLPGFEDLRFTESSSEHLTLPASVAYANERDAILQSAREAWAFRISSGGTLESDQYQSTRTAALGVKLDGNYYIAIDDSDDPAQNILLARPEEGYTAHATQGKWLVSKSDPIIKGTLDRAQHAGRVFPALEHTLKLSTAGTPASAYGAHPITRAVLGQELTEPVATYLRNAGRANGYLYALSPQELDKVGVDNDHVEVRSVGVGGYVYYGGNSLVAVDQGYDGRARGVARKNSTGNKGC
jgi:hypothetical protein